MRAFPVICAALLCGCNRPQQTSIPVPAAQAFTILDEVVAMPEFSNSIVQAQRDFPTDKWEQKPYRRNASRDDRVWVVASRMLDTIKPRFKDMSVSNLVSSLKVVPHPLGVLTNDWGEVADTVYAEGNRLILKEIRSRPGNEIRGLREMGSEKVMLVEGPQGFGLPLAYDLEDILRERGLTRRGTE